MIRHLDHYIKKLGFCALKAGCVTKKKVAKGVNCNWCWVFSKIKKRINAANYKSMLLFSVLFCFFPKARPISLLTTKRCCQKKRWELLR